MALVGLDDLAVAVAVAAEARRHLPDLEAAEVVLADGVALVREHLSLAPVLDPEPPVTLLLEVAGPIGAGERLARHLAGVGGVRGSALATDAAAPLGPVAGARGAQPGHQPRWARPTSTTSPCPSACWTRS